MSKTDEFRRQITKLEADYALLLKRYQRREEIISALLEVAEAAAVLLRPPYRRRTSGLPLPSNPEEFTDSQRECADFERLYEALSSPDCPVEIGEMYT